MNTTQDIHIVFQVLNFITTPESDYLRLTSDEKLLLIMLAKHKGPKGIYPSLSTIAKNLRRSLSATKRSLKKLVKKNIVCKESEKGYVNHYFINLSPPELSTGSSAHAPSQQNETSSVHAPRVVASTHPTSSVHAPQSELINNTELNNTERRIERARSLCDKNSIKSKPDPLPDQVQLSTIHRKPHNVKKMRSLPLSEDFAYEVETQIFAKKLGLTVGEGDAAYEKFMMHYLDSGKLSPNWEVKFRLWLKREADYKYRETVQFAKAGGVKNNSTAFVSTTFHTASKSPYWQSMIQS